MNIDSILNEKGIEGSVENCDVGSVSGHPADWYVATQEIANNMPEDLKRELSYFMILLIKMKWKKN
ncbi:hypothetical protein SDC49_25790 [Lactobacillus sp. R2/2]|nr:hypothetical protein [Lactobacillus sp. R2/2]